MADLTDPALELAELCDRLNVHDPDAGDIFLASKFDTEPWSPEFFQIITSIVNRTAALEVLLRNTKANQAVIDGGIGHLGQIRQAFGKQALRHKWMEHGRPLVGPEHSSPIRMLSPTIAAQHSYPKLSDDEAKELQQLVTQLLKWLGEAQLSERDFIRESLIEGLELFLFRLQRLKWFGWGYSIESLRDVILAYLALERGLNPRANPDAGAALKKIKPLLQKVFRFAGASKEAAETGDWIIGVYRAAVIAAPTTGAYIAGLLSHQAR